jgi:ESS family glutamate:Na+ symporter
MELKVDIYFTLALAAGLLVLGRLIILRVPFLLKYSIPDAVVGGMLAAVLLTVARATANVKVSFDTAMLTPLNVMFFTSVGLMADAKSLVKGGRMLVIFFVAVVGSLFLQNLIGVGMARAFDIHPLNGLLAGSITLAGGHGTGAAWAGKFVAEQNLQGAVELAVACATFGLVAGGLLGGPFANWLISRHGVRGSDEKMESAEDGDAVAGPIPLHTLIETLLLVFLAMAIGLLLFTAFGEGKITLPSFIWALVVGVVLRNALSLTGIYRVDDRAAELIGAIALSLFLSMVIMTLKLWELIDLAIPVLGILAVQTIASLAYAAFVTFRLMGANYDAVLLATGQVGFTLGSTATAIVNMQSVATRYGYSRLAFLLVPVMGAFLIDLANAAVIQGFLFLPWFRY